MCCCSAKCARIFIVISAILMIGVGIAFIVVCCIPQTVKSVAFFPPLSNAIKVVGIVLGIFCIIMGGIGITSTIPKGCCKICLCVFYIIAMKIIFAGFIALFVLSLFLQGAGYQTTNDVVNDICKNIKDTDLEKVFSQIKSLQTSCPSTSTCPAESTVLTCSSQTYLLGGIDTSYYSLFLDFYGSYEKDKQCSGVCPEDRLLCFDFSDITKAVPTNADSCLYSIFETIKSMGRAISIVTAIVWIFGLVNFIAGYVLCCAKDH